MPLLSARTRARIATFDDGVDAAFDQIRGDPVADKLFYAASAVGDLLAGAELGEMANGSRSSAQAATARGSMRERRGREGMGPHPVVGGTRETRMGYPSRG